MPGQETRKKSVRQKLNAIASEFAGRHVLLVDDSIVRGTTSKEIVQMARDAGASKVYFASASPPVKYPYVYGIDMPTRAELLATNRTDEEIARAIGADAVIYQDLDALQAAVNVHQHSHQRYETSCFNGVYVTGDITEAFLQQLEDPPPYMLALSRCEYRGGSTAMSCHASRVLACSATCHGAFW
jgi:amidophosphoribosyltransferase